MCRAANQKLIKLPHIPSIGEEGEILSFARVVKLELKAIVGLLRGLRHPVTLPFAIRAGNRP